MGFDHTHAGRRRDALVLVERCVEAFAPQGRCVSGLGDLPIPDGVSRVRVVGGQGHDTSAGAHERGCRGDVMDVECGSPSPSCGVTAERGVHQHCVEGADGDVRGVCERQGVHCGVGGFGKQDLEHFVAHGLEFVDVPSHPRGGGARECDQGAESRRGFEDEVAGVQLGCLDHDVSDGPGRGEVLVSALFFGAGVMARFAPGEVVDAVQCVPFGPRAPLKVQGECSAGPSRWRFRMPPRRLGGSTLDGCVQWRRRHP